jgi:hypothetical protein
MKRCVGGSRKWRAIADTKTPPHAVGLGRLLVPSIDNIAEVLASATNDIDKLR